MGVRRVRLVRGLRSPGLVPPSLTSALTLAKDSATGTSSQWRQSGKARRVYDSLCPTCKECKLVRSIVPDMQRVYVSDRCLVIPNLNISPPCPFSVTLTSQCSSIPYTLGPEKPTTVG